MDLKRALAGGLVGVALVAGATGCGKITEKATEKATEKIAESASGCEDVDLDVDGGGVAGTCDGQQFEGSATGSASLPDGWPDDLPAPEGAAITVAGGAVAESDLGYVATVPGTVEEVATEVRGILEGAGYTIDEEATQVTSPDNAALHGSDGTYRSTVVIGPNAAEGSVTVTWSLTPV